MIRFLNDWSRFPTATVHQGTKNKSFLELAALYRRMGVKNFYFHLALINPALQSVDPHDPELTEDVKMLIAVECKFNVWYYLREVAKIPPNAGNIPISYKANRGNIALTWLFLCNVDVALIQPRQTGKSVSTDALMTWLLFFALNNTKVALITKDHGLRVSNIERLKKMRDLLPPYLVYKTAADTNNQFEITNLALGNKYITSVAQNSEQAANNVGRGNSVPVLHCDEGPFINLIGTTLPAALAAGTAAREEAELNGQPYGNIFTTTAGKKDDRDGKFMHQLISNGAPWTEHFMDAPDRDSLHEMIKKNCRGHKLIVNCTFNHRQLGKTDEWLYEALSNATGTQEQLDRDFFNIWTSGTQSSPLSVQLNEAVKNSEKPADWVEISPEGFCLRWYIPEQHTKAFMERGYFAIGLDTSEAIGNDDIAFVVVDLSNLSVVCAGNFNETSMLTFSNFLAWFMDRYRKTTLVIERKSTGSAILGNLMQFLPIKGIDPFKRIFNWVAENKYERIDDFREVMQDMSRRGQYWYDKYIKDFGFVTTAQSREILYSQILPEAAKKAGNNVKDKVLSEQIRGLVVKKGRIDHSSGGHDDMVIAWLLAHWFASSVRHLDYYGVDPKYVMSQVSQNAVKLTPEEVAKKTEQVRLKTQIEAICERLAAPLDYNSQMQLESQLKMLYSKVELDGSLPGSMAELLSSIRERRKLSVRIQNSKLDNRSRQNTFKRNREEVTYFGWGDAA